MSCGTLQIILYLCLKKHAIDRDKTPFIMDGIMKKYIFLDFDGVMNTVYDYYASPSRVEKDKYGVLFEPEPVANLKFIIERTGADIVITSSLKEFMAIGDLRDMWRQTSPAPINAR